jgi:hypothetical protein
MTESQPHAAPQESWRSWRLPVPRGPRGKWSARMPGDAALADGVNAAGGASGVSGVSAVPERAWKIFDTVSAKIDHADAKGGAILAICGVTAATILSLVAERRSWSLAAMVSAALAAALTFTTAGFACAALWPRRRRHDSPTSLLYFDHIVRRPGQTVDSYGDALWELLGSPRMLTAGIAEQIWATAHVAARKYQWIDRAMVSLFAALVTLGAAGAILALSRHAR